jgi:hypothetical protein
MLFAKLSTAKTLNIGPALDSTGAEYTSLVIGDLTICKAGTSAAMASAATLTHTSNGHYDLVMTTGNTDTLGTIQIRCNKSTYQIPTLELMVLPATVYDALVTNAAGGANGFLLSLASNQVDVGKFIGTAPTEGASGRLAGGITKFFNVATPTGTVNSIPDAVAGAANGLAIVGSAMTLSSSSSYGRVSVPRPYFK